MPSHHPFPSHLPILPSHHCRCTLRRDFTTHSATAATTYPIATATATLSTTAFPIAAATLPFATAAGTIATTAFAISSTTIAITTL